MKKIQGTHVNVFYKGVTESEYKSFAFARQASVNMKRKMIPISTPETGTSEEYIPGIKSWDMSVGCLLSDDESTVHNIFKNGTKIRAVWRDETSDFSASPKNGYSGDAYIESLKAQGNIHSMASFSVVLRGSGDLFYGVWTDPTTYNVSVSITTSGDAASVTGRFVVFTFDKPLPCDIKARYGKEVFLVRKGESGSRTFPMFSSGNYFWSFSKGVANYNINFNV